MSIIYSLVARGTVILAEHTNSAGNFTSITQSILEKIQPPKTSGTSTVAATSPSRMTYVYDRYLFHYVIDRNILYMCMSDEKFGRRIPFQFLEDVKQQFEEVYGDRALTAIAYGMNEFSRTLAKKMV